MAVLTANPGLTSAEACRRTGVSHCTVTRARALTVLTATPGLSNPEVAKRARVSEKTVQRARAIAAPRGQDPEE
jgi:hypothetical protein